MNDNYLSLSNNKFNNCKSSDIYCNNYCLTDNLHNYTKIIFGTVNKLNISINDIEEEYLKNINNDNDSIKLSLHTNKLFLSLKNDLINNNLYLFSINNNNRYINDTDAFLSKDSDISEFFNKDTYIIGLKSSWIQTKDCLNINTFISLKGLINNNNKLLLNYVEIDDYNKTGHFLYYIVEPEIILNPTILKYSYFCLRKSIFNYIYKNSSNNKYSAIGIILHDVFTKYLASSYKNNFLNNSIDDLIKLSINNNKQICIGLFEHHNEIYNIIIKYKDAIFKIVNEFFIKKNPLNSFKNKELNFNTKCKINYISKINNYESIEKAYQSEVLGMKGILDIVVNVEVSDNDNNNVNDNKIFVNNKNLNLPLEIKTGNSTKEDAVQLAIYSLLICNLIEDNYYSGYLLYLKTKDLIKIEFNIKDLVEIIKTKNILTNYLYKVKNNSNSMQFLPELNKDVSECNNCNVRKECYSNYIFNEKEFLNDVDSETIISRNNFKDILELKDKYPNLKSYYRTIMNILNTEESLINKENKMLISNYNSLKKEINNIRHNLVIDLTEYKKYCIKKVNKNNYSNVLYLIDPKDAFNKSSSDFESMIIGENYLIYESEYNILMNGIILSRYSLNNVTYLVLSILKKYLPDDKLFMNSKDGTDNYVSNRKYIYLKPQSLHFINFRLMRSNLVLLLNCPDLISYIVEYKEQKYHEYNINSLKNLLKKYYKEYLNLNSKQKSALLKSLKGCEKYHLILGYPGSGKTTLLYLLIKLLVLENKKVLVCSHTNQAVDNILLKLLDDNIEFVRLGRQKDKINNSIKHKLLSRITENMDLSQINNYLNVNNLNNNNSKTCQVFGCTVYGFDSNLTQNTKFDVCIVDEACQILEAALLRPLINSDKFILCGDPDQLSPLIRQKHNYKDSYSLFNRLYSNTSNNFTKLNIQYRMNNEIMLLSNKSIYNNAMICGNKYVANQSININIDNLKNLLSSNNFVRHTWIKNCIDPDKPVIFIDYNKNLNNNENNNKNTNNSDIICNNMLNTNIVEKDIVVLIIKLLFKLNYNLNDVGVLAPFKNQVDTIKNEIKDTVKFDNVFTIDRAQGLEKDIIIISFVTNSYKTNLLKNILRMNVCFTRAKCKLIIIGNYYILEKFDSLKKYLQIIKDNNWIKYVDLNYEK